MLALFVPGKPRSCGQGGVATGSHGSSGVDPATGRARHSSTASLVSGIELVIADGSVVEYTREGNPEIWDGLVTSLGCHGVATKLTLDLVPDFDVHAYGYSAIPAEHFITHFRRMLEHPHADSFNAMVNWPMEQVYCGFQHFVPAGSLAEPPAVPPDFFGEGIGPGDAETRPGRNPTNRVVRWHQSIIMSNPKEDQRPQDLRWSEYQVELFVPLEHAEEALRATFKHAAERWGEFVQDPEALAKTPGNTRR